MHMLDTNICIYVLKDRSDALRKKFKATRNLCISSIAYGELCYGIENRALSLKTKRWSQLHLFAQNLTILSWDEDAARHYGALRALLKRQGTPIGNNDLLIASQALSLNTVLVTNNVSEFGRVPNLSIENWVAN